MTSREVCRCKERKVSEVNDYRWGLGNEKYN